jgi:hypothetical protein
VRKGAVVGADGNIANWVVRYNNFRHAYDTNVTWQTSTDAKTANGIWVYYNILGLAHYNIEFWWRGAGSSMSNVYIFNNTLYDSGGEWSADQRPDEPLAIHDAHIACYNSPSNGTNINIKNNIMYGGRSQMLLFSDWAQWSSILTMNNNLYFNMPAHFARVSGSYYDSLEAWKNVSGKDTGSIYKDPLFLSVPDLDFRLKAGSPARDAGMNVGLSRDFSGNTVDVYAPDIGAHEYDPTVASSSGSNGGGCSIGSEQNTATSLADGILLFVPLAVVLFLLLRHRR